MSKLYKAQKNKESIIYFSVVEKFKYGVVD